ncbi:MAG: hypothetical protein EP326_05925 [Deltaproteobacteria bacterium]|nr:MAG: hypothetical protein EP326_05925 [Deltaproteobacteria bacterium]TNF24936.1 MAG: hypothetical protein EP319_17370 [Deltaproteobacteria bacterium]
MSEVIEQNRLFHMIIRVPKDQSAFTYFTFEANDGLCFYSTLETSLGEPYRDIDVKTHVSLKDELLRLIEFLGNDYPIEILKQEEIKDFS